MQPAARASTPAQCPQPPTPPTSVVTVRHGLTPCSRISLNSVWAMTIANEKMQLRLRLCVKEALTCDCCSAEIKAQAQKWLDNRDSAVATREVFETIVPACEACSCDVCTGIVALKNFYRETQPGVDHCRRRRRLRHRFSWRSGPRARFRQEYQCLSDFPYEKRLSEKTAMLGDGKKELLPDTQRKYHRTQDPATLS